MAPGDPSSGATSYRTLLAIPGLAQVVLSMQLARVAQSMLGVAIVLFSLAEYDSPAIAGIVTFASLVPGLLLSPIAGALLDRHGRVRLISLDYLVAMSTMLLVGGLALAGLLSAGLLVIIAAVASITGPLSQTGLRSLFPLMAPRHLWERVNALDSSGYVVATILGPPLAAVLVALLGPRIAVMTIGVPYLVAALVLIGVREPSGAPSSSGRLLADAWEGIRYTWSNRSLRGLGFSISTLNVAGGVTTIVVPLIVLQRLGGSEAMVGLVFALSGIAGVVAVVASGRLDSRGREWRLLVTPMAFMGPATLLMLLASQPTDVTMGYLALAATLVIIGLLNGPLDIGLFTMRQRRTDPAMLGRAFAVSMAFNFLGYPIGSAIAGFVAAESIEAAIWIGVVACLVATLFAAFLVPRTDDRPTAAR
ncbi:MAG: MFS transporter [Chloroflexi bacterium]|nr:MFS transporter [Chloroflexota bacterium]